MPARSMVASSVARTSERSFGYFGLKVSRNYFFVFFLLRLPRGLGTQIYSRASGLLYFTNGAIWSAEVMPGGSSMIFMFRK